MLVDLKVFNSLNNSDNIKVICVVVDDTVDGKDNQKEDIMEVGDIMLYHFNQNNWAFTPPC